MIQTKVPNAATIMNRFPEHPTAEQKLRLVFEELDLDNTRTVMFDGFRRVLKALNIEFTAATVEDLYERMDVNKNGTVTYSEFLNWAGLYPQLIDCIYERSREAIEKVRRDAAVESKRGMMVGLGQKERAANAKWQAALKELRMQERNVGALEEEIEQRKEEEKMRSREMLEVERDADFARTERNSREKDYLAAKEAERDAFKPLNAATQTTERIEDQIQNFENSLYDLQDQERQLQAQLMALKREIQQTSEAIGEANIELGRAKEYEDEVKAVHEDAVAEVKELYAQLQQAEGEVARLQERVNMVGGLQRAAIEATKGAQEDLKLAKQDLAPFREREAGLRRNHQSAARALEDVDNVVRGMEQEAADYGNHRLQVEEDEHPLLEHEVRLREQRYNLDDRDDTHWDEATRFIAVTGRTDTRAGVVSQSPSRAR